MFRSSKIGGVALVLFLGGSLLALGARLREEGLMKVAASLENIRRAPRGKKIGTLLEGVEIEPIGREGKWVRFRMEGWIWGPSLEGFEEEKKEEGEEHRRPRLPLQDELPRIKRLVDEEEYGTFYGVRLDRDLGRLIVRFRIRDIGREVLERRQMALQRRVLEILEGKVEFETMRIESNRPDGSGQVGAEIAETPVEAIRQYGAGAVEKWKLHTRISTDGGQTWSE